MRNSNTFRWNLIDRLDELTTTTYSTGALTSSTRSTYGYDTAGQWTSIQTETDSNGDGTYESWLLTRQLIDNQNPTGYSQVLKDTTTDLTTGQVTKSVSDSIGLLQLSQTTTTRTANGVTTQAAIIPIAECDIPR